MKPFATVFTPDELALLASLLAVLRGAASNPTIRALVLQLVAPDPAPQPVPSPEPPPPKMSPSAIRALVSAGLFLLAGIGIGVYVALRVGAPDRPKTSPETERADQQQLAIYKHRYEIAATELAEARQLIKIKNDIINGYAAAAAKQPEQEARAASAVERLDDIELQRILAEGPNATRR